ncbi:uncharacterized protein LOC130894447 [Diorhabda carinulata]|uniref:uncharacterized protein LOC130894447 n=1 Tax=Diorhabda carinulata TaxID=1163345 RepID=UPI0025A30EFB|nr:uncharacterized protein LOC130894447 [Diorhabda carinulata]
MTVEIKKLDALLGKYMEPNENIKTTNYTTLTEFGDNYGSIMLKLDVVIENKTKKEEKTLNLVAKILPGTELFRKVFNVQKTFSNEFAFYDKVIPTLEVFQKEIGVETFDLFPICYGTRKNLLGNGNDTIDDDAVLLMENLKTQGYVNVNRKTGFNFQTTKLLLTDLARFHGGFLSLKLSKPDLFQKNVQPYCHDFVPIEDTVKMQVIFRDIFEEICKENKNYSSYISKFGYWGDKPRPKPREPFSTVIHTDLWVNNMMHLFKDDVAVKNKIVDFQSYTYGSPVADIFFFLWTSVQKDVLEQHLDMLLEFYHKELVQVLRNHKCYVDFSYKQFLDEIGIESDYGFSHAMAFLMMLNIDEKQDEEYDAKAITRKLSASFKEKIYFMLTECDKRHWIP